MIALLGSPVQAQEGAGEYYQTPGGLLVHRSASAGLPSGYPSSVYPDSGSIINRRSYSFAMNTTDPATGETTTQTGFDFQAFVDDLGTKYMAMIGSIMPLFLKIMIPVLGVIFFLMVVRLISK